MANDETVDTSMLSSEDRVQEKKEFKKTLEIKKLRQLDALEQKLSGFAVFNRAHLKQHWGHQKKRPLASVESLRDDAANNNQQAQIAFTKSPSYLKGTTMRPYQIEGLNWMISLHQNNLNGILADEMGLGKTIQSISMIGYLMEVRKLQGPFLVIVPLSTIENWLKEFARFLPSATILRAHALGDQKKAVFKKMCAKRPSWNVALTTYEFLTHQTTFFKKLCFHYAVIDEGHRAKNELTLFAKALRQCNIQSMVLLTGTPIHNNLHELWALLNLLMPEFFNSAENFDAWFRVEDCVDPKHEQTIRLQNLLKPLMLRRTKQAVTADIPPKVHIDINVPPTEQMYRWTQKVLNHEVTEVTASGARRQISIKNTFMHVRKAVQHPFLIPGGEPDDLSTDVNEDIVEHSPKMIVLDNLLRRLQERGSRVLIFSQFVIMVQILMDYLDYRGYSYCCLHGAVDSDTRNEQIDDFNRPDSDKFIFLLSTRAGGLGINLATADTVIFYDMDFNPQMDLQSEDRAHRIGQTRKVHIFRLLVRGSADEILYHTSARKRMLDDAVTGKSGVILKSAKTMASEYTKKSLGKDGFIDKAALDEKLDELFQKLGDRDDPFSTESGLQEDCSIDVPGVPGTIVLDDRHEAPRSKRKPDDPVPLVTGKRRRTVQTYLE